MHLSDGIKLPAPLQVLPEQNTHLKKTTKGSHGRKYTEGAHRQGKSEVL